MMMTTTSLPQRLATSALGLGVMLSCGLAQAVNDLPGGPAVNQIDLHPPVTRIAEQQMWLHKSCSSSAW